MTLVPRSLEMSVRQSLLQMCHVNETSGIDAQVKYYAAALLDEVCAAGSRLGGHLMTNL